MKAKKTSRETEIRNGGKLTAIQWIAVQKRIAGAILRLQEGGNAAGRLARGDAFVPRIASEVDRKVTLEAIKVAREALDDLEGEIYGAEATAAMMAGFAPLGMEKKP